MRNFTNRVTLTTLAGIFAMSGVASAQWVEFENETDDRLDATSSLGSNDSAERDYQWADLNNNGWVDLVVMRRFACSGCTTGQRQNVLFMNENGVLVDRTGEFASASDVPGDDGFLTPISDRQAAIADVDDNGWKDIITAPSLNDGRPKHETHPRVYKNLGEDAGAWQGFEYQEARIPTIACCTGAGEAHAPRLCGVAAGDVTGDGLPDLYFTDYSTNVGFGGICAGCPSSTFNFNDRLLINQGNGFYADETSSRLPSSFTNSPFGTHTLITDFSGNGANDIAKLSSVPFGAFPYETRIIYNVNGDGDFPNNWNVPPGGGASPYFIMDADLNNNGRLDLVIADDGSDRFTLNQSTAANGTVNWSSSTNLPNNNGFAGNIVTADLNNNGFQDIFIATVDVDLFGWNRLSGFMRSNENPNNIGFTQDTGNIPNSDLLGTYDFAIFDITGNGWKDVVVARGSNQNSGVTDVWIQQPPLGMAFSYPQDRPELISPDEPTELLVTANAFGAGIESVELFVSVDGGTTFTSTPMTNISGNDYVGDLPAVDCGSDVLYYVQGTLDEDNFTMTDPVDAPTSTFSATSVLDVQVTRFDDFNDPVTDWTVDSDSLTSGEWEQANPNVTIEPNSGDLASPDGDASTFGNGMAFITENCPSPDPDGCSVTGGPTYLTSPTLDLSNSTDAMISYERWFYCSDEGVPIREDFLITEVSNDGGRNWEFVHQTGGTDQDWETASFVVGDYVEPTATVQVRFSVENHTFSTTNAAIDKFEVEELLCEEEPVCPEDTTGPEGEPDGVVDIFDLLDCISNWGDPPMCDIFGLLDIISAWGPCP